MKGITGTTTTQPASSCTLALLDLPNPAPIGPSFDQRAGPKPGGFAAVYVGGEHRCRSGPRPKNARQQQIWL